MNDKVDINQDELQTGPSTHNREDCEFNDPELMRYELVEDWRDILEDFIRCYSYSWNLDSLCYKYLHITPAEAVELIERMKPSNDFYNNEEFMAALREEEKSLMDEEALRAPLWHPWSLENFENRLRYIGGLLGHPTWDFERAARFLEMTCTNAALFIEQDIVQMWQESYPDVSRDELIWSLGTWAVEAETFRRTGSLHTPKSILARIPLEVRKKHRVSVLFHQPNLEAVQVVRIDKIGMNNLILEKARTQRWLDRGYEPVGYYYHCDEWHYSPYKPYLTEDVARLSETDRDSNLRRRIDE
jgi:hypothetical protein